ncbi:WbqC family protein, partial [Aliarcobacter butzleri]|uniref:WbqC family protein n=1 Tax=Aliarcobacter butzleri TaxID=28197 RepID=UPI003AF86BF6
MKHWRTISQNYSKAKYFKDYKDIFEELYLTYDEEYLSQINYKFITTINEILEI